MNANESENCTLHQMHEMNYVAQPHLYYHLNGMNSKIFYLKIRRSPLFIIISSNSFVLSFFLFGANFVRLKNGTVYAGATVPFFTLLSRFILQCNASPLLCLFSQKPK